LPRDAPGRAEDAGLLHAVIRRAGPPGWAYLVVPGSRAPLQVFCAEHIQVAERQRAIADPGPERGELPGLGPAGVLRALLVRGEFHQEQVAVPGVPAWS
jgi:hypothetical protein